MGFRKEFITGDASDHDKFLKWAETMPQCVGNPLYHWTHLELQAYFGVTEPFSQDGRSHLGNLQSAKLKEPSFSARGLIMQSNVKVVCTTDDPIDTLGDTISRSLPTSLSR